MSGELTETEWVERTGTEGVDEELEMSISLSKDLEIAPSLS
jgi:hypothetical protein